MHTVPGCTLLSVPACDGFAKTLSKSEGCGAVDWACGAVLVMSWMVVESGWESGWWCVFGLCLEAVCCVGGVGSWPVRRFGGSGVLRKPSTLCRETRTSVRA